MAQNSVNEVEKKVSAKKEDRVTVRLTLDKDHTAPQFVSVNGKTFMIERGKDVEVPVYVKEVLDNKERMEQLAFERSLELQKQAKKF